MLAYQRCESRMKFILSWILLIRLHLFQLLTSHSDSIANKSEYLVESRSDCWTLLDATLVNDCEELNDYGRAFIALQMTECFLQDLGRDVKFGCNTGEDVGSSSEEALQKCISNMDDFTFKIYSQFSTHVTSFCWGQRELLIRLKWETLTNNLLRIGSMSSSLIEAAIDMQNEIISMQLKTVKKQYQTINEIRSMEKLIKNYSIDVGNSYSIISGNLDELKMLIDKTLRRTIISLQPLVEILFNLFGEMMRFDAIYFYMAVFIALIFLTWNYDTHSARNTLITLLVGTMFSEVIILKFTRPFVLATSIDLSHERQLIVFVIRLSYMVILFGYCYYVLCNYWKEWVSVYTTIQNTSLSLVKISESNKFLLGCTNFMKSLYNEINNHFDNHRKKNILPRSSTMIKKNFRKPAINFEPNVSEIKQTLPTDLQTDP